jgi:hypothetical protein
MSYIGDVVQKYAATYTGRDKACCKRVPMDFIPERQLAKVIFRTDWYMRNWF